MITSKELKNTFPHIFCSTSEANQYIKTRLTGNESNEEIFSKVQLWYEKIQAEAQAAFDSDDISF